MPKGLAESKELKQRLEEEEIHPHTSMNVADHAQSVAIASARLTHRGPHLVLHGAHVEVFHGDDVVHVEVVLEAEALLVPRHGLDEAREGVVQLVNIAGLAENFERDGPPAARREGAFDRGQLASHDREEVGRLLEGVRPHCEVPPVARLSASTHAQRVPRKSQAR